jgi:RNA polymerase sigma factor (sigma-70 family)
MSEMRLRGFIRRLQQVVAPSEVGGLADGELLRRWVADRDPAAFEVLLWRHGPMVLGLCQRLLRCEQDAEDVFQSAFLALALKASSIANGEAVAGWLYTVAYRSALQVRAAAARRDTRAPGVLDRLAAPDRGASDLRAELDEEVQRLPAKYRDAFVLCHLEGRTNEEAARLLGRPVGTVVSRLARARQRLRARLGQRGLAPVVALPTVPATLAGATIRAATLVVAGKMAEAVSPPVAALLQRTIRAMWMTKLKGVSALVLAVGLLGVAGGLLASRTGPPARAEAPAEAVLGKNEGPKPPPPKKEAPVPDERTPAPRPPTAKEREAEAKLAQARDEVELLKVQLEVAEARLKAAMIVSRAAAEEWARAQRAAGARSAEELAKARTAAALAQAQVTIREAELREPKVRLEQAQRRLKALERSAAAPGARGQRDRLRELEEKLGALRKEVEALRRELGDDKPGRP